MWRHKFGRPRVSVLKNSRATRDNPVAACKRFTGKDGPKGKPGPITTGRRGRRGPGSRHNRAQSRHQSSLKLGYFRGKRSNIHSKPRGVMGRAHSRHGEVHRRREIDARWWPFFYSFGEVRRPANEAVASALMTPAAEKDPRAFSLARRSPSECESNAPARLYDEASLPENTVSFGACFSREKVLKFRSRQRNL